MPETLLLLPGRKPWWQVLESGNSLLPEHRVERDQQLTPALSCEGMQSCSCVAGSKLSSHALEMSAFQCCARISSFASKYCYA